MIVILTGVAGSGKTTIGQALAQHLACPFYDGDDFHPPANVAKMAAGQPLDDADRAPWLQRLHELLTRLAAQHQTAVLACSALKRDYRLQLTRELDDVCVVYLHGSFELIQARLQAREGHYMSPAMLQSQFQALEPPTPDEAIHVDVSQPVDRVVTRIAKALEDRCSPPLF